MSKNNDFKVACVASMVSNVAAWVSTGAVVAIATAKAGKLTGAPLFILPMLIHTVVSFKSTSKENDEE